ncbi:KPN_02809 family neutral zinc metallopeptidase [Hufsiella ginkgonis]|uniref:Metalloprotease n=1 Tax=Hufsiella ginkgonis TaxID=2695274 RepID=A0A7K1Y3E9_9SPHI|nr:neutral zinc metallopeptidase [Hufsiella ginkgonis]MXV17569.1 metalloprotease [Hufsiella ginkgonis]
MRWLGNGSGNIEDRRSGGGGKFALGGGAAVIALILGLIFGKDPGQIMEQIQGSGTEQAEASAPVIDKEYQFVSQVLGYTEEVWTEIFRENGSAYEKPTVVLFRNSTQAACGFASSATGPFYCPADSKVYLDYSFFNELSERFGAGGDFANAYVIAHEVGHHVQHLMGTTDKVDALRSRLSETEYNKLSVKLELQADFYAGVWAHHAQQKWNILEAGDIEEALNAANAIGDDRLQKQSGGQVTPDSFTHGTSAQRVYWFRKGFETGDIKQGDTFRE